MDDGKSVLYAVLVGILHFIFFVVVIALVISFVKDTFPGLKGVFHGTLIYVIIFGSFVALMAALTAYFAKGTKARMGSGILKAGILIIYHLGIYRSLDITVERQDVLIGVDYPGMSLLVILLLVLYAAYFVFEYVLYREDREEDQKSVKTEADLEMQKATGWRRGKEGNRRPQERSEVQRDQSRWK